MTLKDRIKEAIEIIEIIWEKTPSEVKVAIYLTSSYYISEAVNALSNIKVENIFLMALINLALVFLTKLKGRLPVISEKTKSLFSNILKK